MQQLPYRRILPAAACFAAALAVDVYYLRPLMNDGPIDNIFLINTLGAVTAAALVAVGCGILCRRAYYGIMCGFVFGGPYLAFVYVRYFTDFAV